MTSFQEIGLRLRKAREERGITLYEAEGETRIRRHYLLALESGNPEGLPGEAYLKGFLRTYGNYLGLDGGELVDLFMGEAHPSSVSLGENNPPSAPGLWEFSGVCHEGVQIPQAHQKETRPTWLFYCYSHVDEALRDELDKHLSMLKRQKVIQGWHDRRIGPGKEWRVEIDRHLETAGIVLLLISADFLASDYCYEKEMAKALKQHMTGLVQVIPVIMRPCDWKHPPLDSLQALPRDGKPVVVWNSRDEAFAQIAEGIRTALSEIVAGRD